MPYPVFTREQAIEEIKRSDFWEQWETIASLIRQEVTFRPERCCEADIPIGRSRCGGWPDLPHGMEVPAFEGRPLALLAQFNLRDIARTLPRTILPATGHLYFFCQNPLELSYPDSQNRPRLRVVYADVGETDLHRCSGAELITANAAFPWCRVDLYTQWTLPCIWDELATNAGLVINGEEEEEAFYDILDAISIKGLGSCHHLLGHPHLQQDPLRLTCELCSRGLPQDTQRIDEAMLDDCKRRAMDWMTLANFTSDSDLGWDWFDAGSCTFWIRAADLRVRNFDNVWAFVQW